jgi:hypothetical protein
MSNRQRIKRRTVHHEDTDGNTDRRVSDRLLLGYRLIYDLLNGAASSPDYVVKNGMMNWK